MLSERPLTPSSTNYLHLIKPFNSLGIRLTPKPHSNLNLNLWFTGRSKRRYEEYRFYFARLWLGMLPVASAGRCLSRTRLGHAIFALARAQPARCLSTNPRATPPHHGKQRGIGLVVGWAIGELIGRAHTMSLDHTGLQSPILQRCLLGLWHAARGV